MAFDPNNNATTYDDPWDEAILNSVPVPIDIQNAISNDDVHEPDVENPDIIGDII